MEAERHDPLFPMRSNGGEKDLSAPGKASAEALKELALALRTSVETMHGVRELQAELVKSLKRSDRSEMMLQSTQTLNDTFRNLATIQRELMSRLETTEKKKAAGTRLVPLLVLGLLVVFLGGTFVVLEVLGQMRTEQRESLARAQQVGQTTLAAFKEGKEEALLESEEREVRLKDELEQTEARVAALQGRLQDETSAKAALEAERRVLEEERNGFAEQVRAAENAVVAKRAVEDELTQVTKKLAVVEPRLAELQRQLAEERAETERLRVRLGVKALGHPDPGSITNALSKPPAGEAMPDVDPPTRPKPRETTARSDLEVTRDTRLLGKIRARMNQMLEDSAVRKQDVWQVTSIDGVTPQGLVGVIALRYDRKTGRLLERVEARELAVWVDRNRRVVDMEFLGGRRARGTGYEDLPGGSLKQQVADGELSRVWSQSGMAFLRYR